MSQREKSAKSRAEYLKGSRDIGAETVRVTGNISIPDNENVQFNLIVFGDLTAGKNVNFAGGLHVEGNARLGESNLVKGSIHCEGNMMISRQTTIEKAVYCRGTLLIGKGVRIGLGEDGGGVVCRSTVYVEQEFTVGAKLEAEKIVAVEKLDEELISKLDKERPNPRQSSNESSVINREHEIRGQTPSKNVAWEKTEHNGSALSSTSNQEGTFDKPDVRILSATDNMIHSLTDRLMDLSLNSRTTGFPKAEEKCPRCNSSISDNARFCDTCGLRLGSD